MICKNCGHYIYKLKENYVHAVDSFICECGCNNPEPKH